MVQAVEHQHARAVGLSIVAQIVSGALLGWGLYLTVAIGLALVYVTVSAARSINCSANRVAFSLWA